MSEINVNVDSFGTSIQSLRTLKTTCEAIDVTEMSVVGSGDCVNILNAIDKEYATVKSTFLTLLDDSIHFFENIQNSIIEADEQASVTME